MINRWSSLIVFTLVTGLMALSAAWLGRPVAVAEPPLARLGCVSFSHPENILFFGQRPPVDPADIERELTQISRWTDCVRVYSSDARQEQVVPMAAKLGLKVLLGAWINSHPDTSHADLDRAIALAKKYPHTVKALVVGNEVLTVKEMPIADLLPYLDEARRRSPVPVTIAEVWSIWLDNPELVDHVDFIGAHILPYWDGAPASMEKALTFVEESLSKLEQRFPGKDILIAETGWPSAGRAKGGLAPGVVEQSRFVRAVAAMADRHHWSYNIVESYDQPWKRYPEGLVGGTWGLFDSLGKPKFSFDGPAIPERRWPIPAGSALLLGALGFLWPGRRSLRAAAVAPLMGLLLGWQGLFLLDWISGWGRAAAAVGLFAASLLVARGCLSALASGNRITVLPLMTLLADWRQPKRLVMRLFGTVGGLVTLYQGAALVLCLEEPLQLPSDYYTLVCAIPALAALLVVRSEGSDRLTRILARALPLGGLLAVGLSLGNVPQAWAWAAVTALLAVPLWRPCVQETVRESGKQARALP